MRYKLEKCEFYKKEVDFLEFIIRTNRIKIDPKKIQKVFNWPKPRNLKDLQGFLGFGNFNRQFISRYLLIILLLIKLIKKNILFIWTIFCQKIFNKFKKVFTTVLYLIFFILDKPIRIKTNILDKDIEIYLF